MFMICVFLVCILYLSEKILKGFIFMDLDFLREIIYFFKKIKKIRIIIFRRLVEKFFLISIFD